MTDLDETWHAINDLRNDDDMTYEAKQLVVAEIGRLESEIDRLNATIQRVRELHSSEGRTWADFDTCADCHKAYPCPTTRALEGGEAS